MTEAEETEMEQFRRILRELAVAADTAELLLRKEYPARASSLRLRVTQARELLNE